MKICRKKPLRRQNRRSSILGSSAHICFFRLIVIRFITFKRCKKSTLKKNLESWQKKTYAEKLDAQAWIQARIQACASVKTLQICQDELEVSLFNTPNLARGLFLGAGCFGVFYFLFCSFHKNSQTSIVTRGLLLVEDSSYNRKLCKNFIFFIIENVKQKNWSLLFLHFTNFQMFFKICEFRCN